MPTLLLGWYSSLFLSKGWGITGNCKEQRKISTTLQEVELKILKNQECMNRRGTVEYYNSTADQCMYFPNQPMNNITDDQLCAHAPYKGACAGDSGAPLTVIKKKRKHYLAGVHSWVIDCHSVSTALPLSFNFVFNWELCSIFKNGP